MDDVAIGAAIPPFKLSFPTNPDVVSPPRSETDQDSEDMDSSVLVEEEQPLHTSSYSLLSNPTQLPIIDEVNELFADRAQQRLQQRLDQLKREAEESSTVTYDEPSGESAVSSSNLGDPSSASITQIEEQSSVCVDDIEQPPVQEVRSSKRSRMPVQRFGDPLPTELILVFGRKPGNF